MQTKFYQGNTKGKCKKKNFSVTMQNANEYLLADSLLEFCRVSNTKYKIYRAASVRTSNVYYCDQFLQTAYFGSECQDVIRPTFKYMQLHNKPKAAVHPGHQLTGPEEEEEVHAEAFPIPLLSFI